MKLTLGNLTFEVDPNLELYNQYKKYYISFGIDAAKEFYSIYNSCENIENVLQKMSEFDNDNIRVLIESSCKTLFQNGIYDISFDLFESKYLEKYFDITENHNLSPILEKLQEILDYQEDLENQLDLRKESRGHWEGGGFGVGGAIKGAITASAMNAVGSVFHGIGDSLRKASNNSKVNKLKTAMYNDTETVSRICYAIFENCSNVFLGLRDELISHGILSSIEFKTQEARAMNDNAIKYAPDEKTAQELLIRSVFMSPYTTALYNPIYEKYSSLNGLSEFAAYFAIDKKRLFQKFIADSTRLTIISRMPEYDLEDRWKKLIAYITFSVNNKYSVEKEIKNLSSQIISRYSTSINDIEKTLLHISKNTPSDLLNKPNQNVNEIIETLRDKKTKLQQQEEYSTISKLYDSSPKEIINKIEQFIKFSEKHNTDNTNEIKALTLKLAKKYLSAQDIRNLIPNLKRIESVKYPFLSVISPAFEIKAQIYEYEEKCPYYTLYAFSPAILDAVNEARKGNPICQQWLTKLICNDSLLKLLHDKQLERNIKERENVKNICEYVSTVILYLFDSPEKYSFDLFIRLKFNSIYSDSIDEYIDTMQVFADDALCFSGMFEYGQLIYKHTNGREGVEIIKNAADFGYRNAIEFLYKHYTNKDIQFDQSLFYEILLNESSNYDNMYKCSQNEIDQASLVAIGRIKRIISGDYSLVVKGENTFSEFLYNAWHDFSDSSKKFYRYEAIGYAGGDIADRMILKIVKTFLPAKGHEKCFFSAQTKNTDYVVLLTDKNIHWKNGEELHSKSYSTEANNDLVGVFRKGDMEDGVLYQLYITTYYSCHPYSPDLPIETLEKMAYCGHPLAICNLLSNKEYGISDDKKEIWIQVKEKWQSQGKYFAVCPNCHEVRSKEDVFCPECGAKVY